GMMPFTPWGRFIPERVKNGTVVATPLSQEKKEKARNEASEKKEEEEKKKRNRYLTKKEDVNEKENEEGLTLNIYDKIMSWAQFVNVRRPFDDEPDKENNKKADEMEELSTANLEKTTTTYFDADLEMEKQDKELIEEVIPDKDGVTYTYPEWDYTTKRYKENFSIVTESILEGDSEKIVIDILEEKKAMVKEVKRKFEALTPTSKLLRRQFEGDSIDIDAAVEAVVDLAAGKEPEEGLYTAHRRTEKDISSLFLVDMSMSTDAWVKDRRVIDHEREALIILCEAMQKLKDRYAVYGFSGQTRKNVRVFQLKSFKEKYGSNVRERLAGLIPYHYTRMGPAIRHATKELKKEPSKVKLLFLLSDGKPNDVDSYEGRYGIEDTRMAIKEAESEGIVPFCLTVDTSAHEYLTRLFGKGNYVVTSSVDKLTKTLPDLYARIARNL
ncbi:MAG: VWA domain-containing protein, partial [Deltaproteobacteria bacterium]|nr:VWA domain-containing protein [Deltaproteobacteria bacterium]